MKVLKKAIVCILSLLMISGILSGCSNTDSKPDAESTTTTSLSSTSKETAAEQTTTTETSQEQTELELYKFKLFVNHVPAEMNEISRLFYERWEKENNIVIELEVPPSSNYAERLQIMMSSGDYADVVQFNDHNDSIFINAVEDDVIIPITSYIDMAENLKAYTYDASWDAVRVKQGSDDIYMIPRTSVARNDGFSLRLDWLENVGITIPDDNTVTRDEFKEILRRFTNDDPNKSGNADTYGYSAATSSDGNLSPLIEGSFGILGWQKYDTEEYPYMNLKYSKVSSNYKDALEYTASLWNEGLIDPDWPMNRDSLSWQEKFYRGEVGMITAFAAHTYGRHLELLNQNFPEGKTVYLAGVENSEGKLQGTGEVLGIWGGFTLTVTAKKPERIVMAFDWLLTDSAWQEIVHGPEGVTYNTIDGEKVVTEEYTKQRANRWTSRLLRRSDDYSLWIPLDMPKELVPDVEKGLKLSIDSFVFPADRGYRPVILKDPRFIDAQDKLAQTITRIIVSDLPVSAYDDALNEWYTDGGEEYIKQMNDYLK